MLLMPHFAFIDIAANYTGSSPLTDALGGTQAAVCHLGAALVKKGASVTLINQNRNAGVFSGLTSVPPEKLDDSATLTQFDALIINGRWTQKLVQTLRKKTNAGAIAQGSERLREPQSEKPKIIAWMHEAAFNDPWILPLPDFDGFVFVSNWQKQTNAPLIPANAKVAVIPNGVEPAFHSLFNGNILHDKAPIAIYAGSTKRGLQLLPQIIPALKKQIPELTFEVYSDCNVDNDPTAQLQMRFELLGLSGVTHVDAVPQKDLPAKFKRASWFLSPNPYPETFCICLAEAMAAGCVPIITARAALPETAHGFGAQLPVSHANSVNMESGCVDVNAFIELAAQTIRKPRTEAQLRTQVDFVNSHYNWDSHADAWLALIT